MRKEVERERKRNRNPVKKEDPESDPFVSLHAFTSPRNEARNKGSGDRDRQTHIEDLHQRVTRGPSSSV